MMRRAKTVDLVQLSARACLIILMMCVISIEIVPAQIAPSVRYNVEVGFQRERSRLFVNSFYALVYRRLTQRVQAMRDLQITLPAFQEEQRFLWTNANADMQHLLWQAQPEYLALVRGVQKVIASPEDLVTPEDLHGIVVHDQRFFVPMNTLVLVSKSTIERQDEQLTQVKVGIEALCFLIVLVVWIRTLRKRRRT